MERDKLFLRSKDVAEVLDCSPDDVYRVIARGEMPAIKRGRYWLFRYEDVMAYKERRRGSELPVDRQRAVRN